MGDSEDGSVTGRIRNLESFRDVADYRMQRWEADRESEKRTVAEANREINHKMVETNAKIDNVKELILQKLDDKTTHLQQQHANASIRQQEKEQKTDERINHINRTIAFATGVIVAMQFVGPAILKKIFGEL